MYDVKYIYKKDIKSDITVQDQNMLLTYIKMTLELLAKICTLVR